jgi:hypothetical protein
VNTGEIVAVVIGAVALCIVVWVFWGSEQDGI